MLVETELCKQKSAWQYDTSAIVKLFEIEYRHRILIKLFQVINIYKSAKVLTIISVI